MSDRSDEMVPGPTMYHVPHLCDSSGGEVYWFRMQGDSRRGTTAEALTRLVCNDCHHEVEPDEVLTKDQMASLDVLMGQDVLAMIGTNRLTTENIQTAYEWDLKQVRESAPVEVRG